jgi:hypothetical protein
LTGDYIKLLLFVGCYLLQTTTNHQQLTKKKERAISAALQIIRVHLLITIYHIWDVGQHPLLSFLSKFPEKSP